MSWFKSGFLITGTADTGPDNSGEAEPWVGGRLPASLLSIRQAPGVPGHGKQKCLLTLTSALLGENHLYLRIIDLKENIRKKMLR